MSYKSYIKGHNSVQTASRVVVLSLCTSSDGALYLDSELKTRLRMEEIQDAKNKRAGIKKTKTNI